MEHLLPNANYEGNLEEDFSHENGNYLNVCTVCGKEFFGHKRRMICKSCYEQNNQSFILFNSIQEAVESLCLSKRVKWKLFHGYLCRYTKKDMYPKFVIHNRKIVIIKTEISNPSTCSPS